MKSRSLIVAAALPLLLAIACNGRYDKANLNAKPKAHGTINADTTRSMGVAYEAPKVVADDELKEEAPEMA